MRRDCLTLVLWASDSNDIRHRSDTAENNEEKIRFDCFCEKSLSYTESCYAFATTDLPAESHRQHGYRVQFNENVKYPQILKIVEEVSQSLQRDGVGGEF
jgi:hypothetical protein